MWVFESLKVWSAVEIEELKIDRSKIFLGRVNLDFNMVCIGWVVICSDFIGGDYVWCVLMEAGWGGVGFAMLFPGVPKQVDVVAERIESYFGGWEKLWKWELAEVEREWELDFLYRL